MKENSSNKDGKGKSYVEFALMAMVGTQLVVSVFIGFGIVYWLDSLLGTRPVLMLLFLVLGVAAGFFNVYRELKKAR